MGSERLIRTDTILLTAGLLLIGYLIGNVLLLVFAAVLLAVGLDGLAQVIAARLPVSRGWALVCVTLGVAAIIVAALGLSATSLVQQLQELRDTMMETLERRLDWLS